VISTTSARLLTLVDSGAFLAELYYRLNTLCLEVTVSPAE
jgi:transcriptional regulator of aromatic amino acid metabolism